MAKGNESGLTLRNESTAEELNRYRSACAPLWIFSACEEVDLFVYSEMGLTTSKSELSRYTDGTDSLRMGRKSFGLPKIEMMEGQQHAKKGENSLRYKDEDSPRDTTLMIHLSNSFGDQTSPTRSINESSILKLNCKGTVQFKRSFRTKAQQEIGMESKRVMDRKESNAGSPKVSNGYGDGGFVVGSKQVQIASEGNQQMAFVNNVPESTSMRAGDTDIMNKLMDRLKTEPRNIYRNMLNEELFIVAYHRIKSTPGNMTPGTDEATLDGISLRSIRDIISSLKDQSFQFKPVRREYIPKANGKKRPLGIPSPMDKVVQEVMRMVLEVIFEPIFLPCSHGFRAGHSCHSALKTVSE